MLVGTGRVDGFLLESQDIRVKVFTHEDVKQLLTKFNGAVYFTRILTDNGKMEEQLGYDPETSIGQRAWQYKCKCGELEWLTVELTQEYADNFRCSFCDDD